MILLYQAIRRGPLFLGLEISSSGGGHFCIPARVLRQWIVEHPPLNPYVQLFGLDVVADAAFAGALEPGPDSPWRSLFPVEAV